MGPGIQVDDAAEDLVVLRRSDLMMLLGRFGLPPWPDGRGGLLGETVDCAAIAEEMIAALEAIIL